MRPGFCKLIERKLESDPKERTWIPGPNRASASEAVPPPASPQGASDFPRSPFPDDLWCLEAFLLHTAKQSPFGRFCAKDRFDGEQIAHWRNRMLVFLQQGELLGFLLSLLLFFSELNKWQDIIISFILTCSCKSELFNIFLSNENAIYHYQMKC